MKKSEHPFFRLQVSIWGLLMSCGALACAGTIFGFFGRFSWFMDLFSNFRVQYFLGLTGLGAILLLMRRRKTAVTLLIFACINLLLIAPIYFGGTDAPEGAPTLRAMLINVNTRAGDPARVKSVVQKADPDILVLEEISARWVTQLAWLTNSYPYTLTQPREDNFGIGLYSKLPLTESKIEYIGTAGVPSLLATVNTGRTNIFVIATHPLPPGGAAYSKWRNEQISLLPDYIPSSVPVLMIGDLNVTPWNYHFKRLLKRTGLINSARGRSIQPTWPNFNPFFRIPIDHILHSSDIGIAHREIGEDVASDHFPVIVDFAIADSVDP